MSAATTRAERPVVVGYNGKAPSRLALAWAGAEAARRGVRLIVVFAANYPGMNIDLGVGLNDVDPGALEAADEVTELGVAEALETYPDLHVAGMTELSSPTKALVEHSVGASVLVVGSRGRAPAAAALLSSVSFNVAAAAMCPVIVVKGDPQRRPPGPDHHVVVGTDGSAQAGFAVDFAAQYAVDVGTALDIVCCTGSDQPERDAQGDQERGVSLGQLRSAAERIAAAARERVSGAHPELTVGSRVEDSLAERALVQASADAGLVVVGTRGRGAFRGWLLGSVSHAVIHGAMAPVAVWGGQPDVVRRVID